MLSRLPAGEHIFIDANIFIYHFLGLKESCSELLLRVENKKIIGYTSAIILSEICHRLMKIKIWGLNKKTLFTTQLFSQNYGLLTNDSINLALMNQYKVHNIATNDNDFSRVKDIKVWKPLQ